MCRATDRPRGRNLVAALVVWLVVIAVAPTAHAASVVDPLLRFKRVTTPHFVIYFHQGEDALADRLATIAEHVYADMATRFGWTLPARTHVILVDQTDLANGWATPVPYNTILVTAAWPSGGEFIGQTDDWLRLVFAHEFTHIAHLDRSRGWARAARTVFGRVPFAMPNLSLPGWQIEGIATYFESALTGRGRQFAGDFRAVEREPARAGRFMPLDRANGGLIAWPGGASVYSAGLGFHEHLAQEYGAVSLVRLADATAGRLPYLGAPAFGRELKRPLGRLWRDYQAGLAALGSRNDLPASSAGAATRLTDEAYDVAGARFLPPSCDTCPAEVAYSVRNPHEFPALKVIAATGGPARTLTTRYLGGAIGVSRTHLVFDQRELHRNVSLFSDLFRTDRRTGDVRRLTSGLRLQDPDLSIDGRQIVATRQARGARHLVTAPMNDDGSLGPIATLIAEADTQFATPRWSPDGRRIAVERHRLGAGSEVVVVDVATRSQQLVATGATRAVTPAWRPDGRAIVIALDAPDAPFNLYEFAIDGERIERRRLTTTRGAIGPDVSADGQTLLYVGYTAAGFDVFTQPYPAVGAEVSPETPVSPIASTIPPVPTPVAGPARALSSQAKPYRPWPTLLPRAWTPLLTSSNDQTRIGFTTGGGDVLGYHGYAAAVQWRASAPSGAPGVTAGDPDWSVVYAYDRWLPLFYGSASRDTSVLVGASAVDGELATLREQTLEAGIQLPIRRVRHSQRWLLSGTRSTNTLDRGTAEDVFRRASLRTGWAYRSARVYGYSISPEDGMSGGITAEYARGRVGEVDRATTVTADLRAYAPGLGRQHVLAMRLAGGSSTGPRALGRLFRLGGGNPNADTIDFGRSAFSLLRGFAPDSFAGQRVAVMNVDYRLPLARIERGRGTWPFFLRQVHGSVFVDAGHAWSDRFRARDVKTNVGAEVAADVVIGFALPFTFAAGVARGHDGTGRVPDTTTAYVRVGRAF